MLFEGFIGELYPQMRMNIIRGDPVFIKQYGPFKALQL
jgi:hypothetical protein